MGCQKGGFTHLKILSRGGSRNTYCPVEFAIRISDVRLTSYYKNLTALLLKYKSNDFSH